MKLVEFSLRSESIILARISDESSYTLRFMEAAGVIHVLDNKVAIEIVRFRLNFTTYHTESVRPCVRVNVCVRARVWALARVCAYTHVCGR